VLERERLAVHTHRENGIAAVIEQYFQRRTRGVAVNAA
jgi:hypothetical protein